MCEFILIDLYSQREAVQVYVKNWPPNEIIAWIKRYGEVEAGWNERHRVGDIVIGNTTGYFIFIPHVCRCLPTMFRFEEDVLLIDTPPQYYR